MQHSLTLTLAAWSDWIWIALVGATVVGSWIGNIKKQQQEQRKRDQGLGALELGEMAARRREQLGQASRQRTQANTSAGGPSGDPGNMTMAERIARARAKAQYEQRTQGARQRAEMSQPQVPNEAQRRALAQRQAGLEHRRQAASSQAQAQQQAQRRARQQAQQRATQQRAQAHAQAQAQARRSGRLIHAPSPAPEPTTSTTHRLVTDSPTKRKPTAQPVLVPVTDDTIPRGPLSRADLRRAIILKEVLDKPIALRDGWGF